MAKNGTHSTASGRSSVHDSARGRPSAKKTWALGALILVLAPLAVGAKGCEVAPTPCGGIAGFTCDNPNQYCKFAPETQCGAGDQQGVCTTKPQICPDIYRPVCGCDGKTYGNDCEAAAAGMSVISQGECSTPGKTCGGLGGLQCAPGEFCNIPPEMLCGAADGTGTCQPIPQVCTTELNPVCGCDGKTYPNACEAAKAGVSIASSGECKPATGTACGSRGLPACATGQYCDFPESADCGRADAPGTCAPRPQACTDVYAPVCGCDGRTYSSACFAAVAGVSVDYTGACALK